MKARTTSRLVKWLTGVALVAGYSAAAVAGISATKHNLGTTGTQQNKVTSAGTAEICVFCHTPHAGETSVVGLPLWNKRLPTSATYTIYTSSTMDARRATDGVSGAASIGSVSLACLSCHDGTQAMDNILNAPGSGGYDASGGGTTGLAYSWSGATVGGTGLMTGNLTMLGTDLRNDHPIGIAYCGTTTAWGTISTCGDSDFFQPATGNGMMWVNSSGGTANREKSDMILYQRTVSGGISVPSVECASCHDPHTNTNATFLRVSNAGSAVCLTCHNK